MLPGLNDNRVEAINRKSLRSKGELLLHTEMNKSDSYFQAEPRHSV